MKCTEKKKSRKKKDIPLPFFLCSNMCSFIFTIKKIILTYLLTTIYFSNINSIEILGQCLFIHL